MAFVRTASDITAHDGQAVTAVGTYRISEMGRYRTRATMADGTEVVTNQMVYLRLADGTDLRVGARPDDERAALRGHEVEIDAVMVAEPPRQPPHVAQMDPMPTLAAVRAVRAVPA